MVLGKKNSEFRMTSFGCEGLFLLCIFPEYMEQGPHLTFLPSTASLSSLVSHLEVRGEYINVMIPSLFFYSQSIQSQTLVMVYI